MATTLNQKASNLASIIAQHKAEILTEWLRDMGAANRRSDLMKDSELKAQCSQFVELLAQATAAGTASFESGAYGPLRELLGEISHTRALQGFSAKRSEERRVGKECRSR